MTTGSAGRSRRRVAVVTGCELSPAVRDNGFFPRYVELLRLLGRDHDLRIAYLRPPRPQYPPDWSWLAPSTDVVEIPIEPLAVSRRDRALRASRRIVGVDPAPTWHQALRRQLEAWGADVVIAVGHPLDVELHAATSPVIPTVSFVEEDHRPLPEHRRSAAGDALRSYEELARRRSAAPPQVSVVISSHELAWGRARHPRAEVVVVPHRIDTDTWAETTEPAPGAGPLDVLVVGAIETERNAEGLHAIACELSGRSDRPDQLRLCVVSQQRPHPMLDQLDPHLFCYLGAIEDVRPWYRAAAMALVPAFTVTGAKTTILQAWATGCPVVATTPAAEATGATHGVDVLAGATPREVASAVVRLAGDPELAGRLAAAGRAHLDEAHSAEGMARATNDAIEVALRRPPMSASLLADVTSRLRARAAR